MSATQTAIVKRIKPICDEFDERARVIGVGLARLELAKALAEAEAALAASQARVGALEEALKPFADAYDAKYSDEYLHDDIVYYNKEFRAARDALAGEQ